MNWYVVYIKHNKEFQAIHELEKRGFKTFYPKFFEGEKLKPLFPKYLFVQFDLDDMSWKHINGLRGVEHIVGVSGDFIPHVPSVFIQELMNKEKDGVVDVRYAVKKIVKFTPGQKLKVKGILGADLVGRYCSHTDERITLFLSLLGRKNKVDLKIDEISPFGEGD